jgi:hypothetical protein
VGQVIKRGMFQSFNSATYTATVLILEATSAFLTNVPVSTMIDGSSAQTQAYCAVLFFDEHNPNDAVVIAVYPNSTQGVPSPAPGRVTFVAGFKQISAQTINNGVTTTFQISGAGGIPTGALGVIYHAVFHSPTQSAYIQIAPHNGTIGNYQAIGDLPAANASLNGGGIIQLDSTGQIDIKANVGNCTVDLYTHGYVV